MSSPPVITAVDEAMSGKNKNQRREPESCMRTGFEADGGTEGVECVANAESKLTARES